jgi:bifunctional NMN adenylyltransferase/nudix hydrolase
MTHFTVFIGRFQPFHRGHHEVVKQALAQSDELILVLGSRDRAPALQHPFNVYERIEIIKAALGPEDSKRVHFTFVRDYDYNNLKWVTEVQEVVHQISYPDDVAKHKFTLIGHAKDNTSFYLKLFPMWESIASRNFLDLSATEIRKKIYDSLAWKLTPNASFDEYFVRKYFVNDVHWTTFRKLLNTAKMRMLVEQWDFLDGYKNKWWKRDPKTNELIVPTFNTVDAVVTLGGNVLLIQRGNHPGKGQWALPGGFLEVDERIEDAVVRELHEETKITVPKPALRGAIDGMMVADQIDRDPRGRIISHAFHINLTTYGSDPNSGYKIELPKIKGSDDAKKAKWFTLRDFGDMREQMFADHFSIANELINKQSKSK